MSAPAFTGASPVGTRSKSRNRSFGADEIASLLFRGSAVVVFAITALLVFQLWSSSAVSRHAFGWSFVVSSEWDPVAGNYGALPFIYGTVVTSIIALVIAVPFGVGSAIFLAEVAPAWISNTLTFLIELLAAVPSVIYGLLGVFVLVPILRDYIVPVLKTVLWFLPIFSGPFYGVSFLSAGIVLAIMIVPFIVPIAREVLLSVPQDQRAAALALGSTRWETIWHVVLPYGRRGIIGAVFLSLARALGETMAVTMVIGNSPQISASLLAPGYTAAAVIANEFTEAVGDAYLSALIELALVLFGLTLIMNLLARLCIGKGAKA